MILPDLRRGPLRPLMLEIERQLEHLARRPRRDHPRPRDQRLKPAMAIRPDPSVKRRATDPDQPAIGRDVLLLGQSADQPAALGLRQRRVAASGSVRT
jgi:hypothetical protein